MRYRNRTLSTRMLAVFVITISASCAAQMKGAPDQFRALPKTFPNDLKNLESPKHGVLMIPRKVGPGADKTLVDLSETMEILDKQFLLKNAKNELSPAQFEAMVEIRNLAVRQLSEGQEILKFTSGGSFPSDQKKRFEIFASGLQGGLGSPKGKDSVVTQIQYGGISTKRMALQYQTLAKLNAQSLDWSTYTPSDVLRVGTYMFEVRDLETDKFCREPVPVMADPTVRRVCGTFKP